MIIMEMKKEIIVNKESNLIKYFWGDDLLLDFNLDNILAIGEVTTDQGPFMDDHFLLFITNDKMWNPIPMDAIGFDILTHHVGAYLNIISFIHLANRTDFKSRIVFPKELEGKDFLKLEPIPPKNLIHKIGMWLGIKDQFKVIALSEVYDNLQHLSDNLIQEPNKLNNQQMYSWIFLATALASQNRPMDVYEIITVADGINQETPTPKETQSSIRWLIDKGLINKTGEKIQLTLKGKSEYQSASIELKESLQIWRELEKRFLNTYQK